MPLVGFKSRPSLSLNIAGKRLHLNFPDDFVHESHDLKPEVTISDSEIIFVGHGIVAPEYGWDDYKNVDVRGKTLIFLSGEPAIPDPKDQSKLDDSMFKGQRRTLYSTRGYKYELAAQKGASAVLVVHDPAKISTAFRVYQTFAQLEGFKIKPSPTGSKSLGFEGLITLDAVQRLCAASGQDFNSLTQSALNKNFKPQSLKSAADFNIKSTLREIETRNVVAKIEGSDRRLKNEYVVYTAHWDHLGRDEKLKGDQIHNGAADNAGGTAQLLEVAEGFTKLKSPPKRSILFIATTAEETGLLGAKYYCENPLYPLTQTLANINIDAFNQFGRTGDVINSGKGLTTLDEIISIVATTQNRVYAPHPNPGGGSYFASDQFEFAKAGVPAIFPSNGLSLVGKSADYGKQKDDEYFERDYHQVSDEIKPDWDLSGAVEDAQLLLQVGFRVAQTEKFPEWKPDAEFKARRDKMLKQKKSRD